MNDNSDSNWGRGEQSSSIPKIKIYGKQIYKPDRIDDRERQELHNKYGSDSLLLIFNHDACHRLKECIEWGYLSRQNQVEQGGILLGHVKQYQREIFSFVDDCVLADTRGSSAFVEFTPDMWSIMQQELDSLNAKRNERSQMAIIGWFHTHPNGLSVFMSGTDKDTQNKNFSQDWQVSVVINPQKMEMRAFFGEKIQEGRIVSWSNKPLQQGKDTASKIVPAEMTPSVPEKTGDPKIDAEIARYQNAITYHEKEILKLEQQIVELKKNKRLSLGINIVSLVFLVLFSVGFHLYNSLDKTSMSAKTSEPPITLTTDTIAPVSKKESVVMFSIVSEKWTSHDYSSYCDVVVGGTTMEGVYYYHTYMIKCNSDESFIALEAGTYTITLRNLPKSTDGLMFKDVVPIELTVDGINPKLITIELENKAEEVVAPESTSETGEAATTEPTSEAGEATTPEPTSEAEDVVTPEPTSEAEEATTTEPTSEAEDIVAPEPTSEAEDNVNKTPITGPQPE